MQAQSVQIFERLKILPVQCKRGLDLLILAVVGNIDAANLCMKNNERIDVCCAVA